MKAPYHRSPLLAHDATLRAEIRQLKRDNADLLAEVMAFREQELREFAATFAPVNVPRAFVTRPMSHPDSLES